MLTSTSGVIRHNILPNFSRASEATVENAVFTEVLNFAGKTTGSTAVCPHKFLMKNASSFLEPATYTIEGSNNNYSSISTQDGVGYSTSTVDATKYAQHLFSFDILTWIRNRFPYIGSIDVATLKTLVKKLEVTWVGYGSGEGGNGATLKAWYNNAWGYSVGTNQAISPSAISVSDSNPTYIDRLIDTDGKMHLLAHSTNPADADTTSVINTDYVQLSVTVDLSTIRANQPRYVGSNYALQFDGVDDGARVSHGNQWPNGICAFTLEALVKSNRVYPSDTGDMKYRGIISKALNGSAVGIQFALDWYGSNVSRSLRISIADGSTTSSVTYSTAFSPNVWTHVAATWDGSYLRLFVDGVQVSISTSFAGYSIQSTPAPLDIGRAYSPSGVWDGKIKDARIWNVARTEAEIQANMNTLTDMTGLVARYAFDEGAGLIVNDSAPKAVGEYPYNGVISGATWVAGNAPPFGKGLLVEEGTTNLIGPPIQGRFGIGTPQIIDWTAAGNYKIGGTSAVGGVPAFTVQPTTLAVTDITGQVTISFKNAVRADIIIIQLIDVNGAGLTKAGTGWSPDIGWTWNEYYVGWYKTFAGGSSFTFTLSNLPVGVRGIGVGAKADASGVFSSVERLQVEAKAYATSFTPTTRQPEVLTLPASVLNEAEGEISVWAYEDGVNITQYILSTDGPNTILLAKNSVGQYVVFFNGANQFFVAKLAQGWHLYKLIWKGTYLAFYMDGIKKADKTLASPVTFAGTSKFWLGSTSSGTNQYNNPIDNPVIRNKTQATPEAIAAQAALEYALGGPVPKDENTVAVMDYDGSLTVRSAAEDWIKLLRVNRAITL